MAHKYFISKGQCFVTGQKLGISVFTLDYSLFSEDILMKAATVFCIYSIDCFPNKAFGLRHFVYSNSRSPKRQYQNPYP